MESVGFAIFVFCLIGFPLFLLLRFIFLWYWKINIIVEKLDGILSELKAKKVG